MSTDLVEWLVEHEPEFRKSASCAFPVSLKANIVTEAGYRRYIPT